MELVDTHCHLQFDKLAQNIEPVIDGAKAAGVTRMVCVGTTLEDSRQAVGFAQKHENVWAAAGVHPHESQTALEPKVLIELLKQPKVVAVGEIGLDYYKNYAPKEAQLELLRSQIEAGLPSGLPFIFHVRDAFADFWRIFDEYENLRGVVHSFNSGRKQLDAALGRGLYIGLNGIMTFTKDEAQLEAAKKVPLDKLMLETDAPFLTPAPYRGEVCEPKHVTDTARFLAGLRGEPLEKLARATTENAIKFFNLK